MHNQHQSLAQRHLPWNKGRLIGQKRPLKPKDVWTIRVRLQLEHHARDLALFNLAIDSKLRAAISCGCKLTMSAWAAGFVTAPPSSRRRRVGRCSSKSPSKLVQRSTIGFRRSSAGAGAIFSRAASERSRTCRPGNMPGSSTPGSKTLDWIARPMALTRCGGRRLR